MKVLKTFPAGHPRGKYPAEEYAAEKRGSGVPDAEVIMDLPSDQFQVVTGRAKKEQ
jgi:hypothetical protein